MKKLLIILIMLCPAFSGLFAAEPDVCLVIGQEADPVKGRAHFKTAVEQWFRGQRRDAIASYEKAIIADHSILRHEDHGLAMALLEKYREIDAEQTPALLCKRGFLENILIGNLQGSISFYEQAAAAAADDSTRELALDEVARLQSQLNYLREWQASVRATNARLRRQDLDDYLAWQQERSLQETLEDNSAEIEELQQRLAYLQEQEKEVAEQMYDSVQTASRYRRRYYYPGSYMTTAPDPNQGTVPEGQWGNDSAPNLSQVPNPYSSQSSSGASGDTARYRFYVHRSAARRHQDQLAQIRAEISGLYRQIAQLEKSSRETREKLSDSAVKN